MILPAFLFALALAVRVTWVLAVPSKPVGDFAMYLESATHLLERGVFDPQFIYMPGYVLWAAAVQWLGGGWLATKLSVAVLSAAGAPLVFGITHRVWGGAGDKRSAALAGVVYALWPGGVSVASVTGTDIPAAIFVAAGVYALVRAKKTNPYPSAVLAGTLLGLGAWIRAVALPLIPLGGLVLWARVGRFKTAALATGVAAITGVMVLAPWAVRNHERYHDWFLSDSHGGLTALVGAYPNADGQFTRALNRTYQIVKGRPWLSEPHREADHDAYAEAKRWTRFEPHFAAGLALQRVNKLLSNERSLLYWPLYRAGVLKAPQSVFFDTWRPEIEFATDLVWWMLLWGCLAAIPLAMMKRRWEALSLLPMQGALTAVYVLYFAESRYHLAIAVLAFPGMAAYVVAMLDAVHSVATRRPEARRLLWPVGVGLAFAAAVGLAWLPLSRFGQRQIEQRRWAVNACSIAGQQRFCLWKNASGSSVMGSPVKGVFDGVGLISHGQPDVNATTQVELEATNYELSATLALRWSTARPMVPPSGEAYVQINGQTVATLPLEDLFGDKPDLALRSAFPGRKGPNTVTLGLREGPKAARLWLLGLTVRAVNKDAPALR